MFEPRMNELANQILYLNCLKGCQILVFALNMNMKILKVPVGLSQRFGRSLGKRGEIITCGVRRLITELLVAHLTVGRRWPLKRCLTKEKVCNRHQQLVLFTLTLL